MEPIIRLTNNIMSGNIEEAFKMIEKLPITLNAEDKTKVGKHLYKAVFSKWLNAADSLLEMIVTKLPSPLEAQKYRAANLFEGPADDPAY